jgi:hypothetical protein
MKRPARRQSRHSAVTQAVDAPETTILDLLDDVLDKGAMLDGDIALGVAGVDLVYLRLSTLLCAADRLLKRQP